MSAFDLIFFIVLGVFALLGVWKGFFREVFGLLGIVAGVFLAIVGFGPLSKLLNYLIPGVPSVLWVFLSFLGIFVGVYLLSRMAAHFLSKISSLILLGWLNRLLGGIFGALKGAVFISLFLLLIGFLPFQETLQNVRKNSLLYQPLQKFIPVTYNLVSDFSFSSRKLEKKVTNLMKDLQGKLSENMWKYFFYENG